MLAASWGREFTRQAIHFGIVVPGVWASLPTRRSMNCRLYFHVMKSRASSPNAIRVVLFDVGGVLVEPSGVSTMLTWMRNTVSAEELWRLWLTSPCVRAFETGRLSAEEFAKKVIADFRLPVQRDEFLEEMTRWSVTLFPGAIELVEQIPTRYVRATLCNTNVVHWNYLMGNTGLARVFPHHFASHLIG